MNRPLSKNKATKQPHSQSKSAAVLLLGTIADTTWRMFVPTIGLAIAGLLGDLSFSSSPFLTIAGIISGTIVSYLLVIKQLRRVSQNNG